MDVIISGFVINVKQLEFLSNNDHITFTVKWIEKKENVTLSCLFYCPIRKNDCIYCHCKIDKNKNYIVTRPPMVIIDKSKETIILNIKTMLKIEYIQAVQFYNQIVNEAVDEDKVYEYITSLAEKWHTYHDQNVLTMFGDTDYNIAGFLDYWYSDYNLRELKLLGVTAANIKEYGKSCKDIYNQCIENPYPIYTLTIEQCDEILNKMDKVDKESREKGVILRQLYNNTIIKQWFCCPTSNIGKQFPIIRKHLESLKLNYDIVVDMQSVYIKKYYDIEVYITDFITKIVTEDRVTINDPIDQLYIGKNGEFIRYKALENNKLSKDQEIAVQAALDHKMLLILGGAGVGKTTVIGEIVKNLEYRKLKYILTGFTGKSVSRLQEVTKMKASTMHRLIHDALKIKQTENYDYVIIDEISMVTTDLFCQFIKLYNKVNQFLFVGDNNQLQPIEAGSLLNELLKASVVPTYYLTKNHRVIAGGRDGILLNANMIINHDISFPFEFEQTENFEIIIGDMDKVFEIIQSCYDAGVSINDIMIISPYKEYVKALNAGCKAIYNKNTQSVTDNYGTLWTVDDKVMLLKNIGQILYNGQQGIVTVVGPSSITVDFGENGIHMFKLNSKYKRKNEEEHNNEMTVSKLQHSYANTLHKSQGQESSIVIGFFPNVKESYFLNRPLVYTLITRAKELVYLITPNMEMLTNAACRKSSFRYENLAERLKLKLPKITPFKLIEEKIKINTKDLIDNDPDLAGMEEEEYYDD